MIESQARAPGRQTDRFRTLLAMRKMSPVLHKQKLTLVTLDGGDRWTDRQEKGTQFLFRDDKELKGFK